MMTRVRALLTLAVILASVWLSSCGHYTCGTTFGNATCNASPPCVGCGGGGPGSAAFIYYVGTGIVGGVELDTSKTFATIPNFVSPVLPTPNGPSDITIAAKKFLYLPFADTSQLFAWSIDSGGGLNQISGFPMSAPWAAGLPSAVQPLTSILVSPDGTLLFAADAVDNQIVVFQINATTGALTLASGSPFSTAGLVQPWNLAMDGLGHFLYVTQGTAEGEGVGMAVFTVNSTGALSGGTALPFTMWQVQGEPTGKFLVGTKGQTGMAPDKIIDANLHVFSINPASGVLTETAQVPTPNGPTRVLIHPNGKFVYDFNISATTNFDGPVDGFQLDPTTGALTLITGSPFSTLSIPYGGFFDQSGTYLFFHSHFHIGVWTVDPGTGVPTELTTGQNGVTDLPWVVTDPQ
jgi:6-phosphogluconolactonase